MGRHVILNARVDHDVPVEQVNLRPGKRAVLDPGDDLSILADECSMPLRPRQNKILNSDMRTNRDGSNGPWWASITSKRQAEPRRFIAIQIESPDLHWM